MVISFCSISNAQSKWEKQISGTTEILTYVEFQNPDTGLVVGAQGIILRTTNGGKKWDLVNSGYSNDFSTVTFASKEIAFISGSNGIILKSINNGLTWSKLNSGVSSMLYSINFANINTGYCAGMEGVILKTTNGGNTWGSINGYFSNHIYRINFLNKDTGFVAAKDGLIAKTINGGTSWSQQQVGNSNMISNISFVNQKDGIAVGDNGVIYKTSNTGETWNSVNSGSNLYLNCVRYADPDTAYIVGFNGTILKTKDKGLTWKADDSGTTNRLVSISFPRKYVGYAVGANGTILKLENTPDTIIINYCASNPVVSLIAKDGYVSYKWQDKNKNTIGTSKIVPVTNPIDKAMFSCAMLSTSGSTDSLFVKVFRFDPQPEFSYQNNCLSNTVQFTNLSSHTNGTLTYKWDFGDGNTSTDKNPVHTFATSGNHNVKLELINLPSTCATSKSKIIETFVPSLVGFEGDTTFCPGNTTILNAYGATKYLWSNGSTNKSIEVDKPNSRMWLLGMSSTDCVTDTIFFNVKEEPDWIFEANGSTVFCEGDNTQLSASGAFSYKWSTGETNNTITVTNPGIYTVVGTNKRGCEKSRTFDVKEDHLPSALFSISNTTIDSRNNKINCSVPLQTDTEFTWEMGDGTIKTGADIQHSYNVSSTQWEYKITLTSTNKNGCTITNSKYLVVIPFIPNVFTPNNDGINDIFMPSFDLIIYDRFGISLFNGASGWDGNYDGKPADPDTYFYTITYTDNHQQLQTKKGYVTLVR